MEDEEVLIRSEQLLTEGVLRICQHGAERPEEGKLMGSSEPVVKVMTRKTPVTNGFAVKKEEGGDYDSDRMSSWRGIYAQCLVSGAVFLLVAGCGMPIGYSAILLPQLEMANSTLPTDKDMGSWIASVHSAATPVGSFLSGMIADRWGRREAMRVSIIPFTMGWIFMALADSHWVILVGRLLVGFGVGLSAAPTQVMLGEIAEPKLRGLLSGTIYISYSSGILLVYAMGSVLDWHMVAWLATILPLLSLLALSLLPESPVWMARHGRGEEARVALYWLRGGPSTQAKKEYQEMMARVEQENLLSSQAVVSSPGFWKTFSQAEVLKPFLLVNFFNLLQVVSGTFLVIFYAVDLISQTGEEGMDSVMAAILTALVRLVFCVVASVLLFWVGRRPMAIASGLLSGSAALILASVLFAKTIDNDLLSQKTESYLVVGCLFTYIATNTCGFFVLPGITIGELLPVKVRGLAGGYIFTAFNVCLFAAAKMYPWLSGNLGAHGMFYIFGGSTMVGTLLVYLFIPETKGRSLAQIEDYFKEDNIMWITRDKRRSDLGYA